MLHYMAKRKIFFIIIGNGCDYPPSCRTLILHGAAALYAVKHQLVGTVHFKTCSVIRCDKLVLRALRRSVEIQSDFAAFDVKAEIQRDNIRKAIIVQRNAAHIAFSDYSADSIKIGYFPVASSHRTITSASVISVDFHIIIGKVAAPCSRRYTSGIELNEDIYLVLHKYFLCLVLGKIHACAVPANLYFSCF